MNTQDNQYADLTGKIISCAMKVHNILGNGFQEVIYQRCLALEMDKQGLRFQREMEMPIFNEGVEDGQRRVYFLVEGKIMVELKAIAELEKVHIAQALNDLEAYQLEIGLLINFGGTRLTFKRLIKERK